jgi:hypothetical protein
MDALIRHLSATISREGRHRFKEALNLSFGAVAASGIAFQSFLNDESQRFVAYEHLAATGRAFIAVAPRSLKRPETVHRAGTHTVFGLLGILLALVLGGAREYVLHEQAI